MNTFTLLTMLGAFGVVVSFLYGCRPRVHDSLNANVLAKSEEERHKMFDAAVALTILSALLA